MQYICSSLLGGHSAPNTIVLGDTGEGNTAVCQSTNKQVKRGV
jgi:hypothetical protein